MILTFDAELGVNYYAVNQLWCRASETGKLAVLNSYETSTCI